MNLKQIFEASTKIIKENAIQIAPSNPLSWCWIFDTSSMNLQTTERFKKDLKTMLEIRETLERSNIPCIWICHKEVLTEVYDKIYPGMNLAVFDLKNKWNLKYNESLIVNAYIKHQKSSQDRDWIYDYRNPVKYPSVYQEIYINYNNSYFLKSLKQVLLAPYLARNIKKNKEDLEKINTDKEINFSLVQPKNSKTIEEIKNIFHANLPDSFTLKVVADLDAIIFEENAFNALQFKCDSSLNSSKSTEDDPIIYAEYEDHIAFLVQYGNFKHEKVLMDAIKVYFTKLWISTKDIDFVPGIN